jgi:hypothetical protein
MNMARISYNAVWSVNVHEKFYQKNKMESYIFIECVCDKHSCNDDIYSVFEKRSFFADKFVQQRYLT